MRNFKLLVALVFVCQLVHAQKVNKKIDEIFEDWKIPNNPGGVVHIINDNDTISNAFGQANIKYNIPNTKETVFNIGSVSKQFTAMGIILLKLEGKLSFDDDIQMYLKELNHFDSKVTIRHLLHHTSGIRSTPELFALAGWRDGDLITTEDDYRYLCKQTSLNFEPGSQFMYSNSNYVLLALIVEKVTGQSFNVWMKENVFSPLNMNNTFVDESNSNTLSTIATPYDNYEKNIFTVGQNISHDIGASNIYTTVSDLSIWMQNFRSPTIKWEQAFDLLLTTDTLTNGKQNDYAFGVMVSDFFGNKCIHHNGGVPGFLSYTMFFPDEKLTLILLANFVSGDVNDKFMKLSQLFLENKTRKAEKFKSLKSETLDVENAQNLVGTYWNSSDNYSREIMIKNDSLWYVRDNGVKSNLLQTGENEFTLDGVGAFVSVHFEFGEMNKMIVKDGNNEPQLFEVYDNKALTEKGVNDLTGRFYSVELEAYYEISFINSQLMCYHNRHGEFPIELLKKDVCDWAGMAIVRYQRNDENEIIGFYVDMNRVENVWFEKIQN